MRDVSLPPARASRAESKQQTRAALLAAAGRVFVARGFQNATLSEIAAAAGYTKGAVYWHFRNKEALFVELLSQWIKRDHAEVAGLLRADGDDGERLSAALSAWLDRQDSENDMPVLALELELESRRNPSFAAILEVESARNAALATDLLTRYFTVTGRTPVLPIPEMAIAMLTLFKSAALSRTTRRDPGYRAANVFRILLGLPPKPNPAAAAAAAAEATEAAAR